MKVSEYTRPAQSHTTYHFTKDEVLEILIKHLSACGVNVDGRDVSLHGLEFDKYRGCDRELRVKVE